MPAGDLGVEMNAASAVDI